VAAAEWAAWTSDPVHLQALNIHASAFGRALACGLAFEWARDWKDFAHMRSQHSTEGDRIARQLTPLVPENRQ
jgi:hypothetical protein